MLPTCTLISTVPTARQRGLLRGIVAEKALLRRRLVRPGRRVVQCNYAGAERRGWPGGRCAGQNLLSRIGGCRRALLARPARRRTRIIASGGGAGAQGGYRLHRADEVTNGLHQMVIVAARPGGKVHPWAGLHAGSYSSEHRMSRIAAL